MNETKALILAVTEFAYSGSEAVTLFRHMLKTGGLDVELEEVSMIDVWEQVRQRRPGLLIISHRFGAELEHMQRWKAAGSPSGSDLVRTLKHEFDIPVLMVDAISDLEAVAKACGADAWLEMPVRLEAFVSTVGRLINGGTYDLGRNSILSWLED